MTFHFLQLPLLPIYQQLQIEEALLRLDDRNWWIVNEGSPEAIVVGISGKTEELINSEKINSHTIPVIRRFSGGGTVIVDNNTFFSTFICQKNLHPFPPFPEPIHQWATALYKTAFSIPEFNWKENDYVIGEKKCGGNAQYLKRDRWLHHTTFLWDFRKELMEYLLLPKKTPSYRAGRSHDDFLCTLNPYFQSKKAIVSSIYDALSENYQLIPVAVEEIKSIIELPHRRSTEKIHK